MNIYVHKFFVLAISIFKFIFCFYIAFPIVWWEADNLNLIDHGFYYSTDWKETNPFSDTEIPNADTAETFSSLSDS